MSVIKKIFVNPLFFTTTGQEMMGYEMIAFSFLSLPDIF